MIKQLSLTKITLVTIFLFISGFTYAQSKEENLEKYWSYRSEMKDKFVIVGEGQGESLLAERRDSLRRVMKWADQTISLGWYIGMLATEHHILVDQQYRFYSQDSAQAVEQNIEELYYALLALKRLDITAEDFFAASCNSVDTVHNGFFIRDDVYQGFESSFSGIDSIISDYTLAGPEINEMSQDQAYHLFLGLSLVSKFIPDSVVYQGIKLVELAVDEASLIADWISKSGWKIKNPACDGREVARGADAFYFGHGMNLAIEFITEGEFSLDGLVNANQQSFWSGLSLTSNPIYQNKDNLHMAMVLSAIGNGWDEYTFFNLMELAGKHDYYLYPLLAAALHGTGNYISYDELSKQLRNTTESMLNNAPAKGVYAPAPDTNSHGWNIGRRFTASKTDQQYGKPLHEGNQYSGIGFQLLHNLFYIAFPGKWDSTLSGVGTLQRAKSKLKLIPNPSRNEFSLHYNDVLANGAVLQIFDLQGKLLFQDHIPPNVSSWKVSRHDLSPGTYLIKLTDTNTKQSYETQLVIQRN